MRQILPLALTAAALAAAYFLDLPKTFGAHPWWSQKVVLIGGGAGLAVAFVLNFLPIKAVIRVALFAGLAVFAYALATYGKTQFAASYAEDAFAGALWYFGWIGTPAALAAVFYTGIAAVWHNRV